jgi:hypothetical protein
LFAANPVAVRFPPGVTRIAARTYTKRAIRLRPTARIKTVSGSIRALGLKSAKTASGTITESSGVIRGGQYNPK